MSFTRFCQLIIILLVFPIQHTAQGSVYNWMRTKKSKDETNEALNILATLASHKHVSLAKTYEYMCPANAGLFDKFYTHEPDGHLHTAYLSRMLPLLAGKSVELLQNDLCRIFLSWNGNSEQKHAIDAFCDKTDNLFFSKAGAKSIGKMTKTLQSGKSGFALLATGASTYSAFKIAERLSRTSLQASSFAILSSLFMFIEHGSLPQVLSMITGQDFGDSYLAFDHWIARPFIYRTLSTSSRYALERKIQSYLFSQHTLRAVSHFLVAHAALSPRSGDILAKASAIGSSKILSGTLAASVISSSEIMIDLLRTDPELVGNCKRLEKFAQDVGIVIATNAVISITLPSILLVGRPARIVAAFAAINAVLWVPIFADALRNGVQ